MLWLAWDHPNMPWNGTTLYVAEIGADGSPADIRVIAGGVAESMFQPEWSPDGDDIVFVSDRTGWWNLYAYELATGTTTPLCPMQAEFGVPQWNFAMATFAFAGAGRIVCTYTKAGLGHLATLDLAGGTLQTIETGFTEFGSVRASDSRVVFRGGASDRPTSIVTLDLPSGQSRVLKQATDLLDRPGLGVASYLTKVEAWNFRPPARRPHSDCSIRLAILTMSAPRTSDLPCLSNVTAAQPRQRQARSTLGHSSGPAAASPYSMSITAGARVSVANIANGSSSIGASSTWTTA
jgi:Tol biopolymer transport system component